MNQDSSTKVSYLRVVVFSFFGLVLGLLLGILLISQHPRSQNNVTFLHIFALGFAICGAIIGVFLKVEDKNKKAQSQNVVSIIIKVIVIIILVAAIYLFINIWTSINSLGIF